MCDTEPGYIWHEMSFHTRRNAESTIVLCFDVPGPIQTRIEHALSDKRELDLRDIYALHAVILDEVVSLYETSVWALRDLVRTYEVVDVN